MESPSSDLSPIRMGEATEASLLQSPMEITGQPDAGFSEDNVAQNFFGMSSKEMDQKENLCSVAEDNLGTSALSKDTLVQKKRNRKVGGCNLRKSIAWNQAFFTEEGVLDQLELSLLSRSSSKSSGNLLSGREMSPLTVYNKSSVRPPLHDLEENVHSQVHENSQLKDARPRKLFSRPEASSNREPEAHLVSGKTSSAKGIPRSIPRSPATYSQKRVANVSTTNPTSKLPKFMPAKSHASLIPTTSRNVMLTTKSSMSDQSIVNVVQNVGLRSINSKRDSGCSSSPAKFSAGDHGKNMIPHIENGTASLKVIPNPSSSTMLHEPIICGSGKVASSFPQSTNHVHGRPPVPAHPRPSALRMPSPSLGFFCQGKVSSSYNNQSQRRTQPSESKFLSCRKPMNLRQTGGLRPLTTLTEPQPTKGNAATKSSSGAVISGSSQTCLAANCLKPPLATLDTYLPVEENLEMKQADMMHRRASVNFESSHCQKDGPEKSSIDCLLVGHNIDKQSQVLSLGKPDPDRIKKVPYSYSSSQSSNNSFVEGIQQFLKTKVPENVHDACPPTRVSKGSDLLCPNGSSQICFPRKLQECDSKEIQEGDSGEDNLAKYSHVGVVRDKTYPVIIESIKSAGNSDIVVADLESGLTARNIDCAASAEAKTSLSQRKEQMAGAGLESSLELDHSLTQSSGISVQTEIPGSVCVTSGLCSTSSEEFEPMVFEDKELRDCSLQCDSTNEIISTKEDALMPGKKIFTDMAKQEGVLLNAVPFSDEWLAGVEAFGEDILEKKTGPVQNSPPDKALPEPGPWSPVKRKAQDIGPFDCTKYSKNL